MLLPLKAICNRKKVRRDGTSLIFIQYCYSSEHRTLLNTEIAIHPEYWNKKKGCIKNDMPPQIGDAEALNQELTRLFRLAEDLIALAEKRNIPDKGKFVKDSFDPKAVATDIAKDEIAIRAYVTPELSLALYDQIDDYIASKEKKVSKATVNVFNAMKEHLQAYETYSGKPLSFQSFDYNFYELFVDYLTFTYVQPRRKEKIVGLKMNTVGKTIRQLRVFIRDRVRRKIIPEIDLTDFKILDEETDAIYLTYEEIGAIYRADLSGYPHLPEYRDLFVLACLTGLRFSDFSTLKPEDLRNDMLYKKQSKSDHWVVIPLRKEAKSIFTQQFKDKLPSLTNPEFNRHIKTIGKLAGIDELITFSYKKGNQDIVVQRLKYDWITTHTARRSFCTNEFLAGTPAKLIMSISGHKQEKDFYRYIRITPEEAAGKIKELWTARNEMEVFV